jgi:acyl-CoA thioester hydrolase
MFSYTHQLRVLYGDTDQMGYVYYGNYGHYYEEARAEAIRSMGITYKQLEESGTMMPITRLNIKYIGPAHYDELLTIKTIIPHLPNRIIVFQYEVMNEKDVLINKGETHLTFIDMKTKRVRTAPSLLIAKLKPYF